MVSKIHVSAIQKVSNRLRETNLGVYEAVTGRKWSLPCSRLITRISCSFLSFFSSISQDLTLSTVTVRVICNIVTSNQLIFATFSACPPAKITLLLILKYAFCCELCFVPFLQKIFPTLHPNEYSLEIRLLSKTKLLST